MPNLHPALVYKRICSTEGCGVATALFGAVANANAAGKYYVAERIGGARPYLYQEAGA